ncbi:hypothetical protein GCK32_003581 [Trichostrongylus colubriformis]|uniref:Uncharacterized protein n=1 Tax=Trichostrongylus colubriformis TaxID=6319 RepID=A0AAN8G4G0_TRICO
MDQQPIAAVEEQASTSGRTVSKNERIAALAKELVPTWIEEGRIRKPPMELTDETYQPIKPKAKFQFCIVCGKHSRFDLRGHLKYCHKDFKEDEVEVVMHMSKGILERVKGTKMDFSRVPEPISEREWDTYKFILQQLQDSGVPIHKAYTREAALQHVAMSAHRQYRDDQLTDQPGPSVQVLAAAPTTDDRPQTFRCPFINRQSLYQIAHDKDYKGGAQIHPHFLKPHNKEAMFDYHNDDYKANVYIQAHPVSEKDEWQKRADLMLKLWRKLTWEQHPILALYRNYLIDKSVLIGMKKVDNAKKAAENPSSLVNRFMLVAMRGRGRVLTIIVCVIIQRHDTMRIDAGERRLRILEKGISDVDYHIKETAYEIKAMKSYNRSVPRKQSTKNPPPIYGEMRAVVDHSAIDSKIEEIMEMFVKNPHNLAHVEYNFVMSAFMLYIMVCNATRNELFYKTICGGMAEVPDQSSGIVKYAHQISEDKFEYYWVQFTQYSNQLTESLVKIAHYPNPKQLKATHSQTTCKSGVFVLDKKSYRWLQHYRKLRAHVVDMKGAHDRLNHEIAPFFVLWKGTALQSLQATLAKFLCAVNCDGMNISCNAVRHVTSTLESTMRQDRAEGGSLEPPNKGMATLLGHTQNVQSRHYVDNYERYIVNAYRLLERLAARETQLHKKKVSAVKKRVNTKGLCRMVEGLSEAEADVVKESDDDDSDLQSEDLQLTDEEYVPSRPIQGEGSARKSPRKKAKISSSQQACLSENSSEGSTVMRRPQLVKKVKTKTLAFWNALKRQNSSDDDESGGEEERRPPATVMPVKKRIIERLFKPRGSGRRHAAPQQAVMATTTLPSTSGLQGSPFEFTDKDAMDCYAPQTREQQTAQKRLSSLMECGASPSLTAEKLLLWVGKQSRPDRCLQLDFSIEMGSYEAYGRSNSVLCPETARTAHPLVAPEGANELNKLLGIAVHYANRRNQSVVLVLKPNDQPFATVVLLGEFIPPGTGQRYHSCVAYIDQNGGRCYPVRFCSTDTPERTLSEQFGNAYLLQFTAESCKTLVALGENLQLKLSDLLNKLHTVHAGRARE